MRHIGIVGIGAYVPARVVTNKDLEATLDTKDAWIREKTGIRERHVAAPDEATSDLAVQAAQAALRDAGLAATDIDLIVLATSSPDMIQPPVACLVQGRLGAVQAAAFDLSAVCSGFVYALATAHDMMQGNPRYRRVLVIAAETYSKILDWQDRTTCVYFGDGAGAVVLGDVDPAHGIQESYLRCDGRGWNVITMPAGGTRYPATHETVDKRMHAFRMDGKAVWNFVCQAFPEAVRAVTEQRGAPLSEIDWIISHQANAVLIAHCLDLLGVPLAKTHLTVDRYGNTSGASIGITLEDAVRQGKVRPGHRLVLVGFGGGLAWGAVRLVWGR